MGVKWIIDLIDGSGHSRALTRNSMIIVSGGRAGVTENGSPVTVQMPKPVRMAGSMRRFKKSSYASAESIVKTYRRIRKMGPGVMDEPVGDIVVFRLARGYVVFGQRDSGYMEVIGAQAVGNFNRRDKTIAYKVVAVPYNMVGVSIQAMGDTFTYIVAVPWRLYEALWDMGQRSIIMMPVCLESTTWDTTCMPYTNGAPGNWCMGNMNLDMVEARKVRDSVGVLGGKTVTVWGQVAGMWNTDLTTSGNMTVAVNEEEVQALSEEIGKKLKIEVSDSVMTELLISVMMKHIWVGKDQTMEVWKIGKDREGFLYFKRMKEAMSVGFWLETSDMVNRMMTRVGKHKFLGVNGAIGAGRSLTEAQVWEFAELKGKYGFHEVSGVIIPKEGLADSKMNGDSLERWYRGKEALRGEKPKWCGKRLDSEESLIDTIWVMGVEGVGNDQERMELAMKASETRTIVVPLKMLVEKMMGMRGDSRAVQYSRLIQAVFPAGHKGVAKEPLWAGVVVIDEEGIRDGSDLERRAEYSTLDLISEVLSRLIEPDRALTIPVIKKWRKWLTEVTVSKSDLYGIVVELRDRLQKRELKVPE